MTSWEIRQGDALTRLREMPDGIVQTVVTSPPYWGLRDYGEAGQLGLETTPDEYVQNLVEVFREVRRVLRDDGTVWLNLGDSYAGSWGAQSRQPMSADEFVGRERAILDREDRLVREELGLSANQIAAHPRRTRTGSIPKGSGLKPKDLCGIPWRVAFALQADGWYLRSDIIWAKPNPMPESVTDRPTRSHEYIFLLSKSARYFYDADVVREESSENSHGSPNINPGWKQEAMGNNQGGYLGRWTAEDAIGGRNRRSVWSVSTQPYSEAHFATFPPKLIEPCVLAGSAEGDVVLDPFCGSGTTGMVALRHGRSFVGIELNPSYVEMARHRIVDDAPLLNSTLEAAA